MERYRHWLALKKVAGVGNVLYKRLIDAFNAPDRVFGASETALRAVEGIYQETISAIHAFSSFDAIDLEFEKIEKAGVSLLCLNDPDYPPLLAAIYDPPPFFYWKGSWEDPNPCPIAVVGARQTTHYGKTVTERICSDLASQGVTIVSGFARGVDGYAHRAALAAGARTVAVLGSGMDVLYPSEHRLLFDEIVAQGVILSEFEMGAPPDPRHFPQRNRIISGLAVGCVVIEAALKSGSLITARMALDQGRDVFAVPGQILSIKSAGCHQLIQAGAKLVTGADDILDELFPHRVRRSPQERSDDTTGLDDDEKRVHALLSFDPKHIDQLYQESPFGPSRVSELLLGLELKRRARQLIGQFYVRM